MNTQPTTPRLRRLLTGLPIAGLFLFLTACPSDSAEEDSSANLLLPLLATSAAVSGGGGGFGGGSDAITCGDSVALAGGDLDGYKAATVTASNPEIAYNFFGFAGEQIMGFMYNLDYDGKLFLCNSRSNALNSYNNSATTGSEGFIASVLSTFPRPSSFIVAGGAPAVSGSFRLRFVKTGSFSSPDVNGGGKCEDFNAGLTGECIDFDAQYVGASAYCTGTIGGNYTAGVSCSTTGRSGRCTAPGVTGANQGLITFHAYTGDFPSSTNAQTACTNLFGSFHLFKSGTF